MDWIQQIDVAVLLWIQENLRGDFWTPIWKGITFLGDKGWFWIALGIGLLLFKKTRKVGITVLMALLMGALITNVTLKNVVARTRPYRYTDGIRSLLPPQSDFSFPSGHTCASFAAAWVCWRLLPGVGRMGTKKYFSGKKAEMRTEVRQKCRLFYKAAGVGAMILAGFIAFSRMYLGVHYPTDILGGALAGILAGWLACGIYKKWMLNEQGC